MVAVGQEAAGNTAFLSHSNINGAEMVATGKEAGPSLAFLSRQHQRAPILVAADKEAPASTAALAGAVGLPSSPKRWGCRCSVSRR